MRSRNILTAMTIALPPSCPWSRHLRSLLSLGPWTRCLLHSCRQLLMSSLEMAQRKLLANHREDEEDGLSHEALPQASRPAGQQASWP